MDDCPTTIAGLADLLEAELNSLPHIHWADIDLSNGNVIVVLTNGHRFSLRIWAVTDAS